MEFRLQRNGRECGQAASEYGIAALVIGVVAIAGLAVLGDVVRVSFSGMLMHQASPVEKPASGPADAGKSLASLPTVPAGTELPETAFDPNNPYVELANGTIIPLPNYPADFSDAIETAGGNGTSRMLALSLEQLIQELSKNNHVTAEQASTLQKLANKGHQIANLQQLVEDSYRSSASADEFFNRPYQWEGETLTHLELNRRIGFVSDGPATVAALGMLDSTLEPKGLTLDFVNLYREAQVSGALNDPTVRAVVEQLGDQIALSSELTENAGANIRVGNNAFDEFNALYQSGASHYNAKGICNAGKGNDQGKHCSKR